MQDFSQHLLHGQLLEVGHFESAEALAPDAGAFRRGVWAEHGQSGPTTCNACWMRRWGCMRAWWEVNSAELCEGSAVVNMDLLCR